jgi:hypothetical protein
MNTIALVEVIRPLAWQTIAASVSALDLPRSSALTISNGLRCPASPPDMSGWDSCPSDKLSQPDSVYDEKIAFVRLFVQRVFVLVGTHCDDQTESRSDRFGAHAPFQVDGELW